MANVALLNSVLPAADIENFSICEIKTIDKLKRIQLISS